MDLTADDFLWIGTHGEIEEKLVPREGIRLETISAGAIVGVSWPVRIKNAMLLSLSLGKVSQLIADFKPDVLLLTGGYVNGPVAVSAWLRRIPAVIYLPDIEPGMAIRSLSRLVRRVACTAEISLAYFSKGKAIATGYPVRLQVRQAAGISREGALGAFRLENSRKTLFVFGGSRGARSINRALMSVLPDLLKKFQIIHISGTLDWPEIEFETKKLSEGLKRYYRPFAYLYEEMGAAFRAADLVLARAGASMLGECPAFGLPAILVPYPYAWRYQKVNADYLANRGAAIRLDDEKLMDELLPMVNGILGNEDQLRSMSKASKALDVPDSAARLAQLVLDLGKGRSND
jgi:UDP-N-acetylglucosamine--N-acetylmuramyl-(pentapeptide) pyrophosphoryl-undecaprenol N-acetylglucosamine transferase